MEQYLQARVPSGGYSSSEGVQRPMGMAGGAAGRKKIPAAGVFGASAARTPGDSGPLALGFGWRWGERSSNSTRGMLVGPDHTQRLRALTRVGLAVVLRDARRHRFAATACPPPPLRPAAATAAAACSSYRRCYTAAPATVIVAANTAQHNTSHCTKLHDTRTNRRAID